MTIEITKGLRDLKLFGMATNWPEIVARGRHDAPDPEELMRQLLEAEKADRIVHSIAYQMRAARFPVHRDLAGFAFSESAVDEALVRKQ